MPRTVIYGPVHRVARVLPPGSGYNAPSGEPNMDNGGSGIQDPRLPYNILKSSMGVIGWYTPGVPVIDQVPSAISATNISTAAVPTAGTPLVLTAGTGIGTVAAGGFYCYPSQNTVPAGALYIDGLPGYLKPSNTTGNSSPVGFYDPTTAVARTIRCTSVGDDHLATLAIFGYDWYGYPVHETLTLTSGGVATSKKALKFIVSLTPAGTLSGSNVSVGTSDVYGLPIQAARASMLSGFWNNLILYGTGTFTAAVTTSPATAITGDVRGTFLVGSASDASKRLTMYVAPDPNLLISQNVTQGLFGVQQF